MTLSWQIRGRSPADSSQSAVSLAFPQREAARSLAIDPATRNVWELGTRIARNAHTRAVEGFLETPAQLRNLDKVAADSGVERRPCGRFGRAAGAERGCPERRLRPIRERLDRG